METSCISFWLHTSSSRVESPDQWPSFVALCNWCLCLLPKIRFEAFENFTWVMHFDHLAYLPLRTYLSVVVKIWLLLRYFVFSFVDNFYFVSYTSAAAHTSVELYFLAGLFLLSSFHTTVWFDKWVKLIGICPIIVHFF